MKMMEHWDEMYSIHRGMYKIKNEANLNDTIWIEIRTF